MGVLVMCIGNRDNGDDAIGPYIADRLRKEDYDGKVLDCGTTPENYTSVVRQYKPKTLILIDATDMGLPPGEIRIIPKEKLGRMAISTHSLPISVLIQYFEKDIQHILFIGIQPRSMEGKISSRVQNSGKRLIDLLINKKIDQIPTLQ